MSEEHLKAFLEKVKVDASLQQKLKGAADADAFLTIAKEAGFMISAGDLKSTQSDISEAELEGMAGGKQMNIGIDFGFARDATTQLYMHLTTNRMNF